MNFFKNLQKAYFIERPNRFLVKCKLNEKEILAFLPNPGRLQELLFPGSELYLTEDKKAERKTAYTAVAVIKDNYPVMLHTHKSNEIVTYLIKNRLIPSLEGMTVKSTEVTYGNSRFDFLLNSRDRDIYLEVKSCTQFSEKVSMFPDAVTERGRRHIMELSHMSEKGMNMIVLFLVHYWNTEIFMPDYHTDPAFAKTFLECRDKINYIPLALKWLENLTISPETKVIDIPWQIIEKESEDRGSYLILMEVENKKIINTGKLGEITFEPGYYIYVGSAMTNLSQRIKRHYRKNKKHHWHIDYLREEANILANFPIRSSDRLECNIAEAIEKICDFKIKDFGSSDCLCKSHLFGFNKNPLLTREFIKIVQYFRMDRLTGKL